MATVGSLVVEMGMDIARLQSDVEKARVSLDNVDKNVIRMGRSFEKLTNIYEYANTALKKMHNILSGMAFGFVIGVVSELTSGIMKWWKEMNNAEEIGIKLRDTILNQAQAWKILPIELDKTTESTVRLYNADLKVLQLEEINKGENLRKKIENLEKYRDKLEKNISFMTEFGEVIGDNTLSLAKNQAALEKARAELERWDAIQKMQPTTLKEVTDAISKQTNAISKQIEELLKQQLQLDEHVEAYQKFWDKINNMKALGLQTDAMTLPLPPLPLESMEKLQLLADYNDKASDYHNNELMRMMEMWEYQDEDIAKAYQYMNTKAEILMRLNNVTGAVQKSMEKQLLSLVETGRFSVGEFAKVIMDTIKLELIGLAARAAVWAIFETAAGLASLAWGNVASAELHFSSAKIYGGLAIGAMAGAFGVNAAISGGGGGGGGTSATTGAFQPTNYPPTYTPTYDMEGRQTSLPSQNITINVYNPLDGRVSEEVADAIIKAINEAPNRNITINAQAVY